MNAIAIAIAILVWSVGLVVYGVTGLLEKERGASCRLQPAVARRGQMFRRPHLDRRPSEVPAGRIEG